MKKRIICLICCGLLFAFTGCGNNSDVKGDVESGSLTSEEAEELLISWLGSEDQETGYTYSFGYIDTVMVDDVTYLAFDWRWLVDDHLSRLGDLFVAADGSAIYEGLYSDSGDSEVYTENNYLQ